MQIFLLIANFLCMFCNSCNRLAMTDAEVFYLCGSELKSPSRATG